MLSEKEKLEEELRFLEESFQIGVITKEEFESGKRRIELKLKSSEGKSHLAESIQEDALAKEFKEEKQEHVKIKAEESQAEKHKDSYEKVSEEKEETLSIKEDQEHLAKTKDIDEIIPGFDKGTLKDNGSKRESKASIIIFSVIVIAAVLGSWFLFFSDTNPFSSNLEKITPISCRSDSDCAADNKNGICSDPGTEDSKCQYNDAKTKLTILNSKECFNCKTERVLKIINDFFPNIDINNADIESEEGKKIVDDYSVEALPAYIFNSSISEESNFDKFSSAFSKKNGNFVMKNSVSNSNYYFKREQMQNKLYLFFKSGQEASLQAEKNAKEFLNAFKGKIVFEKYDSNSNIAKELGINTYPTFLINNQIKFSGVQAADTIKENFCQLNKLEECNLELSKSLV